MRAKKLRPTTAKWDSKAMRVSKKLSKRQKLAYLQTYERQMADGRKRDEILAKLVQKIGVGERQVERILGQAKEYKRKIAEHHDDLSIVALRLASNLALLSVPFFTEKIDIVVYGGGSYDISSGQSVELQRVDKSIALNLLCHLQEGFPELANIKDWAGLTHDKITEDLVGRLRLKASRADFMGKCPECPH